MSLNTAEFFAEGNLRADYGPQIGLSGKILGISTAAYAEYLNPAFFDVAAGVSNNKGYYFEDKGNNNGIIDFKAIRNDFGLGIGLVGYSYSKYLNEKYGTHTISFSVANAEFVNGNLTSINLKLGTGVKFILGIDAEAKVGIRVPVINNEKK
ncbi:hypothetical protein KRE40_07445 [Elizabethkingia meningoseptica]|uniref:hypothetical protein n=1 Tax=Elizabethkingia meningoseptica TaxID=238 RepID=UPI0023B0FAAA|nr:hypothetical protein [Elizabethkingia meningoseptica]MDE5437940.1 hypothetical protein [Elizabethkingia meningoseptica]MDE5449413.1 hypothetical protein [Elizabethkingia meningoseptica]MDE5508483.1 hypothetical protein [Elizabethkingia meningoseptica]MDE5516157.1 hypothetical protein [Elizabethkingia meningoseptica]MDE5526867.1 hypothetical protein [Elizabethkingia meningoseptica]